MFYSPALSLTAFLVKVIAIKENSFFSPIQAKRLFCSYALLKSSSPFNYDKYIVVAPWKAVCIKDNKITAKISLENRRLMWNQERKPCCNNSKGWRYHSWCLAWVSQMNDDHKTIFHSQQQMNGFPSVTSSSSTSLSSASPPSSTFPSGQTFRRNLSNGRLKRFAVIGFASNIWSMNICIPLSCSLSLSLWCAHTHSHKYAHTHRQHRRHLWNLSQRFSFPCVI